MFIQRDPIGLLGGTNIYQYVDNPTFFIDPFGLRKTPHKVPSLDGKSGVYILTNSTLGEAYVGSGVDAGSRLGNNKHIKAQALLAHPDTQVEFVEVNLGSASSRRAKGNILRRFEQVAYLATIAENPDYTMKNSNNPEAEKKRERNKKYVSDYGASAKPKTSNHPIQRGCI